MGKIKSWMMDMEEKVDDALSYGGLDNVYDVLDYVQTHMEIVDKSFVLKYAKKRLEKDTHFV